MKRTPRNHGTRKRRDEIVGSDVMAGPGLDTRKWYPYPDIRGSGMIR